MRAALAFVALLLLAVPAPPALAQHSVPAVDEPAVPDVPDRSPAPTGIIPVDDTQEDALRAANATGRTLAPLVGTAWDAQNVATDNAGGTVTFLFDDHGGHRWGGIGPWRVDGGSWEQRATAYSTGGDAAGRYAGGLDALLVLPEIDLATGLADTPRGPATPAKADNLATVWRLLFQHLNFVANHECIQSLSGNCIPWLGLQQDTQSPDGLHLLEFEHRRNLGNGRDGVQVVVFTERPEGMPEGCRHALDQRDGSRDKDDPANGNLLVDQGKVIDETCTIVPTLARRERPLTTYDDQPALTAFDTWTTDAVDLTPWAGRSVWVAFRFLSGGVSGSPYFRSTALFDQEAGFYGFQLGNVSVTGPAPAQSVRLRAPDEPSFKPFGLDELTVAVGADVPYVQQILNLGSRRMNVTLELEAEDVDSGDTLLTRHFGPYLLGPGQVEEVRTTLAGLTSKERTAAITARVRTDAGVATEADRTDDNTTVTVGVQDIQALQVGSLLRPTARAAKDDVLHFRLPLTNLGTVATTAVAKAQVIHAQTNAPTTALEFLDGSTKTIVVPAGASVEATWDVGAREPGQYYLFVTVNDAAPFDGAIDLAPSGLRPRQVLATSGTSPTIDGTIGGTEWPSFASMPVVFDDPFGTLTALSPLTGTLRLVVGGDRLFLSASIPTAGQSPYVLLDRGTDRPVTLQGNVTWKMASSTTNPSRFEASIPLTGATALAATPGKELRLLVAFNNTDGASRRFPPTAVQDGDGLQPEQESRSMRDEMDSWMPFRLPAGAAAAATGRRLSQGVGVDRAPPPLLQVDLDTCGDLAGWTQTGAHNLDSTKRYSSAADKWNCGPYGADGRIRLYEGRTPKSPCTEALCAPFSGMSRDLDAADQNRLVSPAFEIGQAERPYLVLRHQFSTFVQLNDHERQMRTLASQTSIPVGPDDAYIYGHARVYVQALDPVTRLWGPSVLLRPDGGYTTQSDNGVQPEGEPARELKSKEPGAPADGGGGGWGWWWPTGAHPFAKDPQDPFPAGRTFHGSTWQVDRLPLFGFEHGIQSTDALFLENRTIRLEFEWLLPSLKLVDTTEPFDFGWRIEGIAVAEGERFTRDIAIQDLLVEPGTDLERLGLGPAAPTHVNVTLSNEGTGAVAGGLVCVAVTNVVVAAEPQDPCQAAPGPGVAQVPLAGILQPGERRNVTAIVTAPGDGALAKFSAGVRLTAGDDFPADNIVRSPSPYMVQARPDLAILVDAGKRTGAVGDSFPFQVVLVNQGNLPLSDFHVTRRFVFEDGERAGQEVQDPVTWTVEGPLEVGTQGLLQDLVPGLGFADLTFGGQETAGRFNVILSAPHADDIDVADNAAVLRLQAVDLILHRGFGGLDPAAGLAFEGTPGVWTAETGALLAGSQAEMPAHADAAVLLTGDGPVDLSGARSATLSLRHRYDLESTGGAGFDAGRVEISTDGQEWRPLRPSANPLQGLPQGYPSVPVVGDGALVGDAGTAFTGDSTELPGSLDGGWIESSFDLAQDPALSRPALLEAFRLDDLDSRPNGQAVEMPDGQLAFRANDWILAEPGAAARHRSWSVQNMSFSEPAPLAGERMWWSGSAGASVPGEDTPEAIRNHLAYAFHVPLETHADVKDDLLLTWWEWRAGHADGGTGALFTVFVEDAVADPMTLESRGDGWTRRAIDLGGLWDQDIEVRWDYDAERRDGFPEPLEANNRGWFLDEVHLTTFGRDAQSGRRHSPHDLAGFGDGAETSVAPGFTTAVSPRAGIAQVPWTRVGLGAVQGPGGWHLERLEVPGVGEVTAWRFTSDDEQGYPHLADSRLVTPLVDLVSASGDLRLAFDHQYGFEAFLQCEDAPGPLLTECFRSAVDGGAVEYQVFDAAAGVFGPWRQLGAAFDAFPAAMLLEDATEDVAPACDGPGDHREAGTTALCHDHNRTAEKRFLGYDDVLPWLEPIEATGYDAVEDRSPRLEVRHEADHGRPKAVDARPHGHGTSFEAFPAFHAVAFQTAAHKTTGTTATSPADYTTPWLATNVSYLFSGASQGRDGWDVESWDISPLAGKQVRFGFHAASNPSLDYTDLIGEHRGWSVANLRIESQRFVGQPVDLRLRLATDESLGFGTWEVESASLTGALSLRNAAVLADDLPDRVRQGREVALDGKVTPLGSRTLNDLVLVATVLDETHQTRLADADVVVQIPGAQEVPVGPIMAGAHGAFRLPPIDATSGSLPVRALVDMPSQAATVVVRWQFLQSIGGAYVPPAFDDRANAVALWRVEGQDLALAAFEVTGGAAHALTLDPATPGVGEDTLAMARLENRGTIPLEDVRVEWSVQEVAHRAVAGQPFVGPEELDSVGGGTDELDDLGPGEVATLDHPFTPVKPGLYRITATATSSTQGFDVEDAVVEILVDLPATLHAADFTDGSLDGWRDASDAANPDRGGGSPDELRFRMADGSLLWGVDTAAFQQGTTYCSYGSCMFQVAEANGGSTTPPQAPPPVVGLEGIAHGPPIDLTRLPMGQAFVTLRQSHLFELGDGARLEFIPYRAPFDAAAPRPVHNCAGGPAGQDAGKPMPFILLPEPASRYDAVLRSEPDRGFQGTLPANGAPGRPGQTAPERHNPLVPSLDHTATARGGVGGIETLRFRMDQVAIAGCLDAQGSLPELLLANYVVVPVLHVGTLPGHTAIAAPERRLGAQGLQVLSLQVSSTDLAVAPDEATWAVQPGARKSFFIDVTNPASVQDRVGFSLLADHQLPAAEWLQLPNDVDVAPGETRRIPVGVHVPASEEARAGLYTAPIAVSSRSDPTLVRTVLVRLDVSDLPLPDLTVRLGLDAGAALLSGTIEPVPVVAQNIGAAASRPTQVQVVARAADGTEMPIGTADVGQLCPPRDPSAPTPCLGPDRTTVNVQWTLPEQPGAYTIVARADPGAAVPDGNRLNNLDARDVEVVAESLPDLAVTSLIIDGVDEHGLADEGDTILITAVLQNLGNAAATQVRFTLRLGSSEVNSTQLAELAPGESVTLTADVTPPAGRFMVTAVARAAALEADLGNDEARRLIRLRGHDMRLDPPSMPLSVNPGGTLVTELNLTNEADAVDQAVISLESAQGWKLRAFPTPATLAPNQTLPVTLHLTAPKDAPAGDVSLRLLAQSSGQTPDAMDLHVTVLPRHAVPAVSLMPGTSLMAGSGPMAMPVLLASFANVDQDLRLNLTDPSWGVSPTEIRVLAGTTLRTQVLVDVPADTPVGRHNVTLALDATNGTRLGNSAGVVEILARPDVDVTWLVPRRATGDLGERAAIFPLRLRNAGNVPIEGVVVLEDLVTGDVHPALATSPLAPGDDELVELTLRRGAGEDDDWGGMVEVSFRQPGGELRFSKRLPLPSLTATADLRVSRMDISATGSVQVGETVRMVFHVQNHGAVESPASFLHVFANGALVDSLDVPPLAPGAEARLAATWTFDRPGAFVVTAYADGLGSVTESTEDDNGFSTSVRVQQAGVGTRLRNVPDPGFVALALAALCAAWARRRAA